MKRKVVIIGAGKTGRGFIGRLISAGGEAPVFIDRNKALVEALAIAGSYNVRFFGGRRDRLVISGFSAVEAGGEAAARAIAEADGIIVSVGASNFGSVAEDIAKGIALRASAGDSRPLRVVTAENAIAPAAKLGALIRDAAGSRGFVPSEGSVMIAEGAVFCTTDDMDGDPIGIMSEDLDYFPFDAMNMGDAFEGLPGFSPEHDFDRVLTRKIYTYNCASACISYMGHLLGHSSYPEAANDPVIADYLRVLYAETGEALVREFGFTPESQAEFARASLRKFQDRAIADSIERNARDVARKLQRDERLAGPALMMMKHGIVARALPVVYACALLYADQGDDSVGRILLAQGARGVLEMLSGMDGCTGFADSVEEWYAKLSEARKAGADMLRGLLERGIE